jgi:hypothetical protein
MFRPNSLLIISILLFCMVASSAADGGNKRRSIGSSVNRRRTQTETETKAPSALTKSGKKKKKKKKKSAKTSAPSQAGVNEGGSGSGNGGSGSGNGGSGSGNGGSGSGNGGSLDDSPTASPVTTPETGGAQKTCESNDDCEGLGEDYFCARRFSICCEKNEPCQLEGAPTSGGSSFASLTGTSVAVSGLISAIALNF